MGRKRTTARKYIYFFTTSLLILNLLSCTSLKEEKRIKEDVKIPKIEEKGTQQTKVEEQKEVFAHLILAKKLLSQGDYDGSLRENQKALFLSGKNPPGDEALFNTGLIYSHYGNPKKDFKSSLEFFQKLLDDYPQSPLIDQAKIWIGVLQVIEESKKVDIEIEQKKKELSR